MATKATVRHSCGWAAVCPSGTTQACFLVRWFRLYPEMELMSTSRFNSDGLLAGGRISNLPRRKPRIVRRRSTNLLSSTYFLSEKISISFPIDCRLPSGLHSMIYLNEPKTEIQVCRAYARSHPAPCNPGAVGKKSTSFPCG